MINAQARRGNRQAWAAGLGGRRAGLLLAAVALLAPPTGNTRCGLCEAAEAPRGLRATVDPDEFLAALQP
jgi:hypothetical protein